MRQNVGLVFLTLGSVLLSIGVLRTQFTRFLNFYEWKNVPWEAKLAFWFRGIRDHNEFVHWLVKVQEKEHYPSGEKGELALGQRIGMDLPLLAILMMLIGFFLCLDYVAIRRFLSPVKMTKTLITIVGCSITVLGIVLRQVGNRIRRYDEYGKLVGKPLNPGTPIEARNNEDKWGTQLWKASWWLLTVGPIIQLIAAVIK